MEMRMAIAHCLHQEAHSANCSIELAAQLMTTYPFGQRCVPSLQQDWPWLFAKRRRADSLANFFSLTFIGCAGFNSARIIQVGASGLCYLFRPG